jgi:hypothetical protein
LHAAAFLRREWLAMKHCRSGPAPELPGGSLRQKSAGILDVLDTPSAGDIEVRTRASEPPNQRVLNDRKVPTPETLSDEAFAALLAAQAADLGYERSG